MVRSASAHQLSPFSVNLFQHHLHHRIPIRGKEIVAFQMPVPFGVAGVDAGHLHFPFRTGRGGIVGIDLDPAAHLFKRACHLADHHVARLEGDARVGRIHRKPEPFGGDKAGTEYRC
jgi:hypothetical protein